MMLRYILKRLAIMPLMLLLVSFFLFLVINISPTDPAIALLPADYTQEDADRIYKEYGFNDPLIVQYGHWLSHAVQGDLGISYQTDMPIWDEAVLIRLPVSAEFGFVTILVVLLVGIPLGVLCAVKQYTFWDGAINIVAKTFGSIPAFLYSVILTYFFSIKLGWLPSYGMSTPLHWILPVISNAIPPIGGMIRQTRSSMLDCIRMDYITTARSKGIPERRVIFGEALKNALLPVITMTGGQIAMLIGGSVVMETVFSIPGLGAYIVTAIQYKDTPAIMGSTVLLAMFFMVITLIVDISYAIADPRTKGSIIKAKRLSRKIKPAVTEVDA